MLKNIIFIEEKLINQILIIYKEFWILYDLIIILLNLQIEKLW